MNDSGSKIKRFAPTRHILPPEPSQPTTIPDIPDNSVLSLSELPDNKSVAAKQTYKLQEQINAQRGGMPRYGEITGNDVVAKTARLQEEINRRRLAGN